jgi:hydrogenase-4 membrane subunit HyfE
VVAVFVVSSKAVGGPGGSRPRRLGAPVLARRAPLLGRRIQQEERVSPIGTLIYLVLLVLGVLIVGSYTHFSLVIAQNPLEQLGQALSVNLVAALSLFLYGLIALLSQHHPFKMVLGLMTWSST